MRHLFSWCVCSAAALLLSCSVMAEEVKQAAYDETGSDDKVVWSEALGQLGGGVELAQFNPGSIGGGSLSLAPSGRGNRFFIGGEWLYMRANPSEAVTYLEKDLVNFVDTFNQFDFDYESAFRVYGGCRNCCGEEIRFTYSRFNSGSGFESPTQSSTTQIISTLEQTPLLDGSRVVGSANVELNDFDLGWSKTIPLGSPLGCCDCCDPCGDCCGDCCGCWCPAWDITFTGALRIVDFGTDRVFTTLDNTNTAIEDGRAVSDFQGAGARVGVLGRRYFGRQGIFSVYLKGDISMLVGEYENTLSGRALGGTVPIDTGTQRLSCRHVIPVTEIEAGGTVFVTCNTSITGGYFMSAWHDLGFRDEYNFGDNVNLNMNYDGANIMGFDGFFLRAETQF